MLESVLGSMKPERDFAAAVSQFTKDDLCALSGFPPERVEGLSAFRGGSISSDQ